MAGGAGTGGGGGGDADTGAFAAIRGWLLAPSWLTIGFFLHTPSPIYPSTTAFTLSFST